MNRIQFWILTSLSALVALLLLAQILLVRAKDYQQARLSEAQQIVAIGKASNSMVNQLAARIYEEAQKTQDQGLKDLVIRQNIKVSSSANSASPAPAPAASPAPTPLAH